MTALRQHQLAVDGEWVGTMLGNLATLRWKGGDPDSVNRQKEQFPGREVGVVGKESTDTCGNVPWLGEKGGTASEMCTRRGIDVNEGMDASRK